MTVNSLFGNVGTNNPSAEVENVQFAIKNKLDVTNPDMVKDNGAGQDFFDGVFYAHSTKAYIQLAINQFIPSKTLEQTSVKS
mgnify:CR=1 FL=1